MSSGYGVAIKGDFHAFPPPPPPGRHRFGWHGAEKVTTMSILYLNHHANAADIINNLFFQKTHSHYFFFLLHIANEVESYTYTCGQILKLFYQ